MCFSSWPLVGNFREVSSPIYQAVKVEGPSFPTGRASQFLVIFSKQKKKDVVIFSHIFALVIKKNLASEMFRGGYPP